MPDETRTWFTSMFSGDAQPGDVVTSRALNITKITAFVVPIVTVGVAAVSQTLKANSPLRDLTPGQRLMIFLFVFTFVALVILADMAVRAYTTGQALMADATVGIVTIEPGLKARLTTTAIDPDCVVIAIRGGSGGQFLIAFADEGAVVRTRWVGTHQVQILPAKGTG